MGACSQRMFLLTLQQSIISDSSDNWLVESNQTNSVVIAFDLDGEAESDFTVSVNSCGTDTNNYSITTLEKMNLEGKNPLTVKLTNLRHIGETTYCFKVSLFANGAFTKAISETHYEYGTSY